ncbi:hypothetical protein V5E97_37195 [Singulisphaera sp. Ch08]|uniref:Glycosyltransferase RgtA/B/C/D-like domain-containing protein n=1 Tax=Singulisphaera sp. Ch08 TaxID=3120278 RepID=A0AAU7CFC4_9BACT
MSKVRIAIACLLPLTLLGIVGFKIYHNPYGIWPFPPESYALALLRSPKLILAAVVGLFAPMPLCLTAAVRIGRRRGETDAVGILVAQLSVLVVVGLTEFFGLVATGLNTRRAFLMTQAAIIALGLLALRRELARAGMRPVERGVRHYLFIIGSMVACGLASVHFGADCGWDLFNYHYYNAYAFLNHRHGFDFAVADKETHFNPLLDVAYYLVVRNVRPVWGGFIFGAVHGLAVTLLFGIAYEVLGRLDALRAGRIPLAAACAFAGVCEPMFLAQLGTTWNDVLLTSFVLAAVLVVVRLVGRGDDVSPIRAGWLAVLAGGLIGMAAGFKLTSATYAVGMTLALLASPVCWRRRLGLAAAFAAGVVPGLLLTNGFWMSELYVRYGNPIFPLYNTIFKSPYWTDQNMTYHRVSAGFRWYDHLLVPFYLAQNKQLLSEVPSADPRLAIACVLLLLTGLGRLLLAMGTDWRSPKAVRERLKGPFSPDASLLVVFAVASYVVWYLQFRIVRYLTPVKLLAPLVCVLLLLDLLRGRRRVWVASAAVLIVVSAGIDMTNLGRRDWNWTYLDFKIPKFEAATTKNGIVLMIAYGKQASPEPFGAVVAELPPEMRYIRIDSPQIMRTAGDEPLAMEREVLDLVRKHQGPVYLLTHNVQPSLEFAAKSLVRYDLALTTAGPPPKRITGWCRDLGLWRLERRSAAAPSAVAAAPGDHLIR